MHKIEEREIMKRTGLILAAVGIASGVASADVYSWEWNAGDTSVSNNGGIMEHIETRYNTVSERFVFNVTFSNQITEGYTLAVSPGANPKGHAGELALLYFDANDMNNVRLNAFAYNGQNTQTSYNDGTPAAGIQAPDKIATSLDVIDAATIAATAVDHDGKRTFSLTLDATAINAHIPANPGPGGPAEWTGLEYGALMGIWFHPVRDLTTAYGGDGFLTNWDARQGWLDGSNFTTTVPAPASAASLLALAFAGRRRRSC